MNAIGKHHATRYVLAALALASSATVGCGGGGPAATGPVDYATVRAMAGFYEGYLATHNNAPPKDEQAFREYLSGKQADLEKFNLTVDKMFTSPRGGGSFTWTYGGRPPTGASGMTYIGYESTSIDGKRLVIATRGMFEELAEADFKKAFPKAT
jgi:hypothetical protein